MRHPSSSKRSLTVLILALAASASATLWPAARARACSPDPCPDPVRTFGPNAHVPGNLVRFLVTGTANDLALHTAAGEEVPASLHEMDSSTKVFMTDSDVAADVELVLTYSYACNASNEVPFEAREGRYELSTFAAEPIEKMAPALVLSEQGRMFLGPDFPEHVFKRFGVYSGINPSVAGHLLIQDVSIDSHPRSISPTGEVAFAANCEQTGEPTFDSCGGLGWLSPGRHTVLLRTHLIGETVQPEPIEYEIELECGAAACIADGEEPGSMTRDDSDLGMSGSGAQTDESDSSGSSSSGCSAAPGRSSSPAVAWIALLALLATVSLRRSWNSSACRT